MLPKRSVASDLTLDVAMYQGVGRPFMGPYRREDCAHKVVVSVSTWQSDFSRRRHHHLVGKLQLYKCKHTESKGIDIQ